MEGGGGYVPELRFPPPPAPPTFLQFSFDSLVVVGPNDQLSVSFNIAIGEEVHVFSIDFPVNIFWTDGRNYTTFRGARIVEDHSLPPGAIGYAQTNVPVHSDESGILGRVPEVCEIRVRSIHELCRDQEVRWVDTNERVTFPTEVTPESALESAQDMYARDVHFTRYLNDVFYNATQAPIRMTQEAMEAQRREQLVRQEQRLAREARAHELLVIHLDEEQCRTYAEKEWFDVPSSIFKRRKYRIHKHFTSNVTLLERKGYRDVEENWRYLKRLCAVPRVRAPLEDQLLSQKLLIETDEHKFLDVAIG